MQDHLKRGLEFLLVETSAYAALAIPFIVFGLVSALAG